MREREREREEKKKKKKKKKKKEEKARKLNMGVARRRQIEKGMHKRVEMRRGQGPSRRLET